MGIKSFVVKVKAMDRKTLFIAGAFVLLLINYTSALSNQDDFDAMQSKYEQQIRELESEVASKQDYIAEMNSDIENLSSEVDRFEYEDWRYVVRDVYSDTKSLESNIQAEP